ncbi:MAG TPA: hypothetical protein DDX39_07110 [Bacteroidales bacterium]|nr:MAG: hypothetical protein A2W98_12165 [Bacteroidetes bacterium GWF2_33_38]OFY75449.1 MAG: hypothetical protein A2265_11510 [Bacteroidetes bacterium RIFOXYA12_FULL_33_9]OFY91893.1 MAG: hypothetical protein A2236_06060 [Bacteroidetes bacterium RIFOXYA2_FULL_33_7]HBF88398.1 hypothetical protein [Bacteroidales bacterium]
MKICKIYIKDFQQFKDIELDFTNPTTGEPLDKICFIGRNGTGKSTLLNIIKSEFEEDIFLMSGVIAIVLKVLNDNFTLIYYGKETPIIFKNLPTKNHKWIKDYVKQFVEKRTINSAVDPYYLSPREQEDFLKSKVLKKNSNDLLAYIPPESTVNILNGFNGIPNTTLNEALKLFNDFPYYHEISNNTVNEFWKLLIFLVKLRENDRNIFENLSQNINKTKRQLIEEFDEKNPQILKKISIIWDKILSKSDLEFDYKNAQNPIQLSENLKAYIKLKSTGETIQYNQLSTGIRNFIFRLGHIYSLYFNREIKNGFLLVDEPENSLYPDFLFDLVETYLEVIKDKNGENNTQFFVATHNPIIAAQFAPYERIILDWNNDGTVSARKGTAPIGDDPNDILTSDFELKNLMGKEGLKMWEKYVDLKKQLHRAKNKDEKDNLIAEISRIGSLYNFEA